jgi:hypothetical protein
MLKLPHTTYFGEVPGVSVKSKGQIYLLSPGNMSSPASAAAAAERKGRRLARPHLQAPARRQDA